MAALDNEKSEEVPERKIIRCIHEDPHHSNSFDYLIPSFSTKLKFNLEPEWPAKEEDVPRLESGTVRWERKMMKKLHRHKCHHHKHAHQTIIICSNNGESPSTSISSSSSSSPSSSSSFEFVTDDGHFQEDGDLSPTQTPEMLKKPE